MREDFCGSCALIPLALGGAGLAGIATREQYYSRKWIIILSLLATFVFVLIMYKYNKRNGCSSCSR